MSLLKLKGRIISFVEDAHANGYAVISSMLMETEDGRRVTITKKLAVRSDILLSLQDLVAADTACELFIEKTRWAWMATPQHIFGLKSEHIAQFDAKNLGLRAAFWPLAIPLCVGLWMGFWLMFGGFNFFATFFISFLATVVLAPPLWVLVPSSLVTLVGILATKLNRRSLFYGDAHEAKRVKALEPVTL